MIPGRRCYKRYPFHDLITSDGGATWTFVTDLPPLAPDLMCGISVVGDSVAYVSGTNDPTNPTRMMKTLDAGATWTAWDMGPPADLLVDNLFLDADHGFVVGGKDALPNPERSRSKVRAVVLHTTDGGQTWTDRLAGIANDLPLGEWGWKIQFLDDRVGFVALESFTRAAILKTTDGGLTWTRAEVHDPQGNANLEGIGFLDEQNGWVGGWGSASFEEGFSSATSDGGATWRDANEIGLSSTGSGFWATPVTVGYASGMTVYKYSDKPVPIMRAAAAPPRLFDNEPRSSVWVPRTRSRHATCTYSCTRPPSRSRRSGWIVAPEGGGVWPAGGCWSSDRCGRCVL